MSSKKKVAATKDEFIYMLSKTILQIEKIQPDKLEDFYLSLSMLLIAHNDDVTSLQDCLQSALAEINLKEDHLANPSQQD